MQKVKPAPTVIELNETGFYQNLDPRIEAVKGVYLFDRNAHTHVADTSPSYELISLYCNIYFKDAYDREDEEIQKLIEKYEEDWRIATNPVDYYYARNIEKIIEDGANIYTGQQEQDENETYEEFMESCREYYNGNHMI